MITTLEENQIFVFGSNLAGHHGGGAARQAWDHFGAEDGVGEGMTGQCYAFPTLDTHGGRRSRQDLQRSVQALYQTAQANPDKQFLLTKVGCGIAGYEESFMKSLFAKPPANLVLPQGW